MITKAILGFARNLGYKNVAELQAFKRAIKAGSNAGSCRLTLESSKMTDFVKSIQKEPFVDDKTIQILNLTRAHFPQAYAPDIKSTLDVAYKRFGEKSGVVEMMSTAKNGAGVELSSAKAKIAANSSGGRVIVNASSQYGVGGQYDISVVPSAFKQSNNIGLLKQIKYNEVNGSANISLPQTQVRGFKGNLDVTLPVNYTNSLTGIMTNFECVNYGQLLSKLG